MSKTYLPADPRGLRAFYFCIRAHQASVEPDAQAQTLEMVDLRIEDSAPAHAGAEACRISDGSLGGRSGEVLFDAKDE